MKMLRLSSSSSLVVPFPIQTLFNQHLTSNLKTLLLSSSSSSNDCVITVSFLAHALDALVATQKLAHQSLPTFAQPSDREAIERYLEEDSIDLLDACNGLGDRMDNVCEFVKSLRLALHCLEAPTSIAVARANKLLLGRESSRKMTNSTISSLIPSFKRIVQHRRMNSRATKNRYDVRSELEEILDGSSVVTSTIFEILDSALSFKLKHGNGHGHNTTVRISQAATSYSSYHSWLSLLQELRNNLKKETKKSLQVRELQNTVWLAQELRQELMGSQDCSKLRVRVEELKRSCDELENGLKPLQGKVKEVYRYLICVRMGLLEKLSSMA
nr:protein BPS1, chloroplastic-like [Ipomoea batatas]GMC60928.1 protein BPS1, chloroplastic-like [Ipomoea batatas]